MSKKCKGCEQWKKDYNALLQRVNHAVEYSVRVSRELQQELDVHKLIMNERCEEDDT